LIERLDREPQLVEKEVLCVATSTADQDEPVDLQPATVDAVPAYYVDMRPATIDEAFTRPAYCVESDGGVRRVEVILHQRTGSDGVRTVVLELDHGRAVMQDGVPKYRCQLASEESLPLSVRKLIALSRGSFRVPVLGCRGDGPPTRLFSAPERRDPPPLVPPDTTCIEAVNLLRRSGYRVGRGGPVLNRSVLEEADGLDYATVEDLDAYAAPFDRVYAREHLASLSIGNNYKLRAAAYRVAGHGRWHSTISVLGSDYCGRGLSESRTTAEAIAAADLLSRLISDGCPVVDGARCAFGLSHFGRAYKLLWGGYPHFSMRQEDSGMVNALCLVGPDIVSGFGVTMEAAVEDLVDRGMAIMRGLKDPPPLDACVWVRLHGSRYIRSSMLRFRNVERGLDYAPPGDQCMVTPDGELTHPFVLDGSEVCVLDETRQLRALDKVARKARRRRKEEMAPEEYRMWRRRYKADYRAARERHETAMQRVSDLTSRNIDDLLRMAGVSPRGIPYDDEPEPMTHEQREFFGLYGKH